MKRNYLFTFLILITPVAKAEYGQGKIIAKVSQVSSITLIEEARVDGRPPLFQPTVRVNGSFSISNVTKLKGSYDLVFSSLDTEGQKQCLTILQNKLEVDQVVVEIEGHYSDLRQGSYFPYVLVSPTTPGVPRFKCSLIKASRVTRVSSN